MSGRWGIGSPWFLWISGRVSGPFWRGHPGTTKCGF